MADEQDRAEALDDDKTAGEFPPDHLLGAEAYGAAGADPGAPESPARRLAKEEPEVQPLESPATVSEVERLDVDDIAGGADPTLRDVVQEREAPQPAEEAAMHVVDEGLGDFDSDVDDPALEAAWELDPEVER